MRATDFRIGHWMEWLANKQRVNGPGWVALVGVPTVADEMGWPVADIRSAWFDHISPERQCLGHDLMDPGLCTCDGGAA